jgi:hypothetical protein
MTGSRPTPAQHDHLARHDVGVIAVVSPEGRLHQSVVRYVLDGEDICMSTEEARIKARYAAAGGEVRFTVMGTDAPHPSVTVIGHAEVERTGIAEITGRVMAQMGMTDPVTDEELAAVGRVVLRLHPERVQSAWI